MKTYWLAMFVSVGFVTGCARLPQESAQGPFDPGADARAQVTNAVVEAREFNRNVLLVFGANWCSDSRATVQLFNTDPAISRVLKSSYIVEKIDVGPRGSTRNADLVERYHATVEQGIPVLVVLNGSGEPLNDTRVERLNDEDHQHPELILQFLERYAPAEKNLP